MILIITNFCSKITKQSKIHKTISSGAGTYSQNHAQNPQFGSNKSWNNTCTWMKSEEGWKGTHSLQIIGEAEDPIAIRLGLGFLGLHSWHLHLTEKWRKEGKFSHTQEPENMLDEKERSKLLTLAQQNMKSWHVGFCELVQKHSVGVWGHSLIRMRAGKSEDESLWKWGSSSTLPPP